VKARVGTSGTYFTKFDQNFGENPVFSVLNTSGFNGVFPSIQFKLRTSAGIDLGKLSADLFWNHIGDYNNWSNNTVTPIERDAIGNPLRGGDVVDATNTFDLNLSYKLSARGMFEDLGLSLNIRNLTDEDPPFMNHNQGGFMGGAWGYDNYTANPIGRLVTLAVRGNF
jgi:iron complex outermembrane receptor protein